MKQGGTSIPLILPPEMTRGQSTKKAFSQRIGAWVVALCKMGLREKNMADFWAKQRSKNPLAKRLDILSICGSIISVPCRAYHPGKWPSPIDMAHLAMLATGLLSLMVKSDTHCLIYPMFAWSILSSHLSLYTTLAFSRIPTRDGLP